MSCQARFAFDTEGASHGALTLKKDLGDRATWFEKDTWELGGRAFSPDEPGAAQLSADRVSETVCGAGCYAPRCLGRGECIVVPRRWCYCSAVRGSSQTLFPEMWGTRCQQSPPSPVVRRTRRRRCWLGYTGEASRVFHTDQSLRRTFLHSNT